MDIGNNKRKVKKGSLEENPEVDSVSTSCMDSLECMQILFNCLPNFEKKVKEIHEILEMTQNSQIKGDCNLMN